MFISIKKYLNGSDTSNIALDKALLRMAHLLLTGIASHAVEPSPVEYEQFRSDILALDRTLGEDPSASHVLVIAGAVTKALAEYRQRAMKLIKGHGVEMQKMVAMLTETITVLSAGHEQSIARLQAIEKQIERASEIEDIRVIKGRLCECLTALREETLRRREEHARAFTDLRQELEKTRRFDQPCTAKDPLTGLPDREEAEKALRLGMENGTNLFVSVFTIKHVTFVNGRFGYAVGDQMLNLFGSHLHQHLLAGDRIFRWRGPCFVVLLERSCTMEEVRGEVDHISRIRLEKIIESGNRSVLLPVSSAWTVFGLHRIRTLGELLRQIEEFAQLEGRTSEESKGPS